MLENVVKKETREMLVLVDLQDLLEAKAMLELVVKGLVGDQGERGEHGQRGKRGEKGVQGDTADVLSVLAAHLPIQLAER